MVNPELNGWGGSEKDHLPRDLFVHVKKSLAATLAPFPKHQDRLMVIPGAMERLRAEWGDQLSGPGAALDWPVSKAGIFLSLLGMDVHGRLATMYNNHGRALNIGSAEVKQAIFDSLDAKRFVGNWVAAHREQPAAELYPRIETLAFEAAALSLGAWPSEQQQVSRRSRLIGILTEFKVHDGLARAGLSSDYASQSDHFLQRINVIASQPDGLPVPLMISSNFHISEPNVSIVGGYAAPDFYPGDSVYVNGYWQECGTRPLNRLQVILPADPNFHNPFVLDPRELTEIVQGMEAVNQLGFRQRYN